LDFGLWTLDFGLWTLVDFRFWILDFGKIDLAVLIMEQFENPNLSIRGFHSWG
jgi:hypothetical protein